MTGLEIFLLIVVVVLAMIVGAFVWFMSKLRPF